MKWVTITYKICSTLALVGLMLALPPLATGQSSGEIIREMEEVMRGESSHSEMTMRIERPRYTRDISMET
ncbi:MAG: hypothetical protein WD381_01505, partial [Balneolaceae bacterium]